MEILCEQNTIWEGTYELNKLYLFLLIVIILVICLSKYCFSWTRQQFRKTLTKVDWMDDMTRQEALEKADAMASHIAYPSEMLDNNRLTEFYSGVSFIHN